MSIETPPANGIAARIVEALPPLPEGERKALLLRLQEADARASEAAPDVNDTAETVLDALGHLPLDERAVTRAALVGLADDEIAALLGAPVPEVRRLRERGADELRVTWVRDREYFDFDAALAGGSLVVTDDVDDAPAEDWAAAALGTGTREERFARFDRLLRRRSGGDRLRALAAVVRNARRETLPPTPSLTDESDARVTRRWGFALGGVAVLALVWAAYAQMRNDVRPPVPEGAIPVPIEPEGPQGGRPSVFRWRPGGDDVDCAQVLLYRSTYARFWETGPVTGNEVVVPPHAFDEIPEEETLLWRVREVRAGKPRASSRYVEFSLRDPSDAPPEEIGPEQSPLPK